MKRTFAYGAAMQQGAWPVQEDGYFLDPLQGFVALADGFGGRGVGDIAARTALQEARSNAGEPLSGRSGTFLRGRQGERQREMMHLINKKVLEWNEKRPAASRGGCSLLLAEADRERREFVVSQCGSCAAFLLRKGSLVPLLTPQAPPRTAAEDGAIPDQGIGLGAEISPETRAIPWEAGDILFLFSGGLYWEREGFAVELAAKAAQRIPGSSLEGLVGHALGGGDSDWNQTALAIEALE
jgi:serine/threonine protein phosphatase PrpC